MTTTPSNNRDPLSSQSPISRHCGSAKTVATRSARQAVVLLHSSAASSRQWDALVERLAPDFEVHAIDFHGHGLQAPWRAGRPMSVHDEMALVLPIIERVNGVHVIGHSYGATVALSLAAAWPTHVRSLTLFEPVLLGLLAAHEPHVLDARDAFDMAEAVRLGVAAGQAPAAAERFVRYWSGAKAWERLHPRQQRSMIARMPEVAKHFPVVCAATLPTDQLSRLNMPMLCLTGGRTTAAARRIGSLLRELLPGAQHETIDAVGHLGPITHPGIVNEHVLRFLAIETSAA